MDRVAYEAFLKEALGVSQETVSRDWRFAKSWLLRELSRQSAQRVIA